MGCGKSTVGSLLADKLDRPFLDTDIALTVEVGRSVADIFTYEGEAAFRTYERRLAERLSTDSGMIIATGGGFFLDPFARQLFAQHRIICLTASAETVYERVKQHTHRPLLQSANPLQTIRDLMHQRRDLYSQFVQINTDGKAPHDVVRVILRYLEHAT